MEESEEGGTKSIKFRANPKVAALLDRLVDSGLFGKDRTAVVRTLVLEGIRSQVRDGLLKDLE